MDFLVIIPARIFSEYRIQYFKKIVCTLLNGRKFGRNFFILIGKDWDLLLRIFSFLE